MITMLVIMCLLIVVAFIVAAITGLMTVAPILLVVICLPLIDYIVFKLIRKCNKKDKKKKK